MVRIACTSNITSQTGLRGCEAAGDTVHQVMAELFARHPKLRGYLLDDQGAVRKHVTVYIDSRAISDRRGLSDPVPDGAELFIAQALSGG